MKNLTYNIAILIAAIFFGQKTIKAQEEKVFDSVTVYIGNEVEVLFEMEDFDILRDSTYVLKSLKEFEEHIIFLNKSKEGLNPNESDLLTLQTGKKLTAEIVPTKVIFLRNEDASITNTGIRDKAILYSKHCKIEITAGDFSLLTGVNFQDAFYKLLTQLPEKSRVPHTLLYKYQNQQISYLESKSKVKNGNDIISLGIGAGAGLIKNQWVGDFGIRLGITLMNRNKIWHKFYSSANFLYDFSNGKKANVNTFLNVGYEVPYYFSAGKDETLGLEAGYLISRKGNTFDENTFRLGLLWSPSSSITVSPQVYFPGKLKGAYPGIRIGFGF